MDDSLKGRGARLVKYRRSLPNGGDCGCTNALLERDMSSVIYAFFIAEPRLCQVPKCSIR